VTNCTFSGNSAPYGDGGLDVFDNEGSIPRIVNSILWSSATGQHALSDYPGSGPAVVRYSDVAGGSSLGNGNIDSDPGFAKPNQQNFGLSAGSPCIDAADGDAAPAEDFAGNPRYDDPNTPNTGVGAIQWADMGALEYQAP